MSEPEFIFESDKMIYAQLCRYEVAKSKEEKDEAIKSIINALTYYTKNEADVVSLFIDEGPEILAGTITAPNGKKYIPAFLVKNGLGVFKMPERALVTKFIRIVRDAYLRTDVEGLVLNPFGKPNIVVPKKFLKIVVDVYDGKL